MAQKHVINVDLADVWAAKQRKNLQRTLAWGDKVAVTDRTAQSSRSALRRSKKRRWQHSSNDDQRLYQAVAKFGHQGSRRGHSEEARTRSSRSIRGRAAGRRLGHRVAGGQDHPRRRRRQSAVRALPRGPFRGTTAAKPKPIDCILVTHGDADHFVGLPEIFESETQRRATASGCSSSRSASTTTASSSVRAAQQEESARQGASRTDEDGRSRHCSWSASIDNLLTVPDERDERAVQDVEGRAQGLQQARQRSSSGGFSSATMTRSIPGRGRHPKSRFSDRSSRRSAGKPALEVPGQSARRGRASATSRWRPPTESSSGFSASHTINGHSIVFRLTYGGFSYPVLRRPERRGRPLPDA